MLEALAAAEVKKCAYELLNIPDPLDGGCRCLAVTLVDGITVTGTPYAGARPRLEFHEIESDSEVGVVEFREVGEPIPFVSVDDSGVRLPVDSLTDVTIPLEQIAGVYPFVLHWPEASYDPSKRLLEDFRDLAEGPVDAAERPDRPIPIFPFGPDLLRIAEERNFPIDRSFGIVGAEEIPVFGPISFGYDTAMYCDWDAISRRQGGLNSLGVSVPWGGLSAGFSPSLWSAFHKTMRKRSVALESICVGRGTNDVMVRGFPQTVDLSAIPEKERTKWLLEAEGAEWMPIVITADSRPQPPWDTWALAYAKRDCDMMPTVCWEKIPSPSRFFGEIVHEEVTTEWGQKNCYLKLRAVAHLARDEGLAVGYADVSNR